MKRLLITIAVTSLPFATCAQGQTAANPVAPVTTAADLPAPVIVQDVQQTVVTSRQAYEVPPERVKTPLDSRPKPNRGAEWQRRQAALEQDVRDSMSASGFTDTALQNTILEHIQKESRARAPLRERGRRLYRGLNSPKVNDAEMSLALGAYITALDADRARRTAAETALDAKIGWSTNPRLHSMLLLYGIIGESPITLPLRNFNQPPRAVPRPDDGNLFGPADTKGPAEPNAPAQPNAPSDPKAPAEAKGPAMPRPPAETLPVEETPPVTVVPLDDPPVTDAPEEKE